MKIENPKFIKIETIANLFKKKDSLFIQLLSSTMKKRVPEPAFINNPNIEDKEENLQGNINNTCDEDAQQPQCCGPDATDWLKVELDLWVAFAWQLNNLTIAWGIAANRARPWYQFWVPSRIDIKAYQYACLAILGQQLTYAPTTTFSSASGLCPQNCPDTVTICGGCIDRSEIGNFIYGVIARYFQMIWIQTLAGSIAGNRGRRTNSDAAAVELGYDFIDQANTNANNLGAFLSANTTKWNQMQEDGHGCPPCIMSIVPAGSSHVTLPPISGLGPTAPITITIPPNVIGQP